MKKLNYILVTGLIAGTLDAVAASVQFYLKTGKSAVIVWQYVASAVFGKDAFTMNNAVACGLLLHYIVAMLFTVFYFLVVPYVKPALKYPFPAAIVYGAFVWVMMNLVIVPMTKAAQFPIKFPGALIGYAILVFAIAMPSAIGARKLYRD